jgi:predicted MPP superfamily phosphohydrolase
VRCDAMLKLSSSGRGTHYTVTRGVIESILGVLYRRDWPARLWAQVPDRCTVNVIRRTLRVLPAGTPDLRLGFASDLHIGPTTPARVLEGAADALAAEALDLLLLGGDYVFLEASRAKARALEAFVRRARAKRTVAVLGNHDLWTAHAKLEQSLEAAGASLLINANVRLATPHEDVALVGLDDPWTGAPDASLAFRGAATAGTRIVLCHSPDGIVMVEGRDVALFLCGHTHGGHVALPWGPIIVPGRAGKEMWAGFHEAYGAQVFVSRGLGGIELPIRTFARPDVAVLTLTA